MLNKEHKEYLEEIDDLQNKIADKNADLDELDNYIDQIVIPTCEAILELGLITDQYLLEKLEYIVDDMYWEEENKWNIMEKN